jgi:hypothetical protein
MFGLVHYVKKILPKKLELLIAIAEWQKHSIHQAFLSANMLPNNPHERDSWRCTSKEDSEGVRPKTISLKSKLRRR